ncbi:MAG: hypothetical protein ACREQL_13490 [Candidatus Binatia bacterium]
MAKDHDPLPVMLCRIDDLGEIRLGLRERRLSHMTILTITPPACKSEAG